LFPGDPEQVFVAFSRKGKINKQLARTAAIANNVQPDPNLVVPFISFSPHLPELRLTTNARTSLFL
jgi:hypothetical protein